MNHKLIQKLLTRGDRLEIIKGRLLITSASGRQIPLHWLKVHNDELIHSIVCQRKINAFLYTGYSSGNFSKGRYPGVQLQFENLLSGNPAFCVFNADLTYSRGKNKGKPLPAGRFKPGKRSAFIKFWKRTSLKIPSRSSSFHDYMGNLRQLLYSARFTGSEKIEKSTLQPLEVSYEQILAAFNPPLPNNDHTPSGQEPYSIHTTLPYSDFPESHTSSGPEQFLTTSQPNQGSRLSGSAVTGGKVIALPSSKKSPQEQTSEEWLADYFGTTDGRDPK